MSLNLDYLKTALNGIKSQIDKQNNQISESIKKNDKKITNVNNHRIRDRQYLDENINNLRGAVSNLTNICNTPIPELKAKENTSGTITVYLPSGYTLYNGFCFILRIDGTGNGAFSISKIKIGNSIAFSIRTLPNYSTIGGYAGANNYVAFNYGFPYLITYYNSICYVHAIGAVDVSKLINTFRYGNYYLQTGSSSGSSLRFKSPSTVFKDIMPEVTEEDDGKVLMVSDGQWITKSASDLDAIYLTSSTSGSTKKFKITVDDSGTISTTEVKI